MKQANRARYSRQKEIWWGKKEPRSKEGSGQADLGLVDTFQH